MEKALYEIASLRAFARLAKNTAHVITLFVLPNVWVIRRKLIAMMGLGRPQAA